MPDRTFPVGAAIRFAFSTMAFAALLFLAAGTVAWPAAWAYLAIMTGMMALYGTIVVRLHPDLIEERTHPPADAKQWDKPFVAIVGVIGPVVLLLLAGLDRRFHWSPPASAWSEVVGLIFVAAGPALSNYAVASNRYFSSVVRIQRDRGHRVVDAGPYRFVRHPAYAASIIYMAGAAIALGSRVALVAAAVLSAVLVVRTVLEDRVLQRELDGYTDYARRVRYRLVPWVW
jgi:protein-S-isoprenylcysteine O-methyltransferase Ste14